MRVPNPDGPQAVTVPVALMLLALTFLVLGPTRQEAAPFRPPSDAMASLQFLHAQRAYPRTEIPADRYQAAWRTVQLQRARRPLQPGPMGGGRAQTVPAWSPLGPRNVGGRTTALAVNPLNPNVLLAGAASGGLWRSDTAGIGVNAWHYVDTGFPVLGVGAVAISPADTGTVYIGTGEVYRRDSSIGGLHIRTTRGSYGIGILKSTDGGLTWSKSLDWSYQQQRGVLVLRIDPSDPDRIFAGTSHGLWRSTDAGASWGSGPVLDRPMVVDLALHPTDTDTLYASCGNLEDGANAGIWRSFDGGETWVELGGGLPGDWTGKTMLDIYRAAPNVVYADVANWDSGVDGTGVGLYRSTDHGDTWENLSAAFDYGQIATYQGWFSHFVVVHPADSSQVLAAGVDVWKSNDGGRTFDRKSYWYKWYYGQVPVGGPEGPADYSHADHHAFARHPNLDGFVFLGTDGGVFATADFGEHFAGRNGGYQSTQFYAGFSSAIGDSTMAMGGLQDNSTVVYRGGAAWQRTLGGDGGMTALDPGDRDRLIASTQYGRVYVSPNGGGGWIRLNSEMENSEDVAFVAPLIQEPGTPGRLYAGRSRVWRSDDWGEDWRIPGGAPPLDGDAVLAIGVSPVDQNMVWASTVPGSHARAQVFLSTDQARSWTNVTGSLPDRYIVDLVPSPVDPAVVYATVSGFGTDHLWRRSGSTWEPIGSGLPDVPTSAVAVDPLQPDHLYLGNDYGVWFSADGGTTWEAFDTGMPTAALVMDLSVSPSNRSLRAVTHGSGVWERPLVSTVTGTVEISERVRLLQNRPNPFNGTTRITWELPETMPIRLELFNVRGQRLAVLVDTVQGPGYHTYTLSDRGLASGIYFYRLVAGSAVQSRRLVLIR